MGGHSIPILYEKWTFTKISCCPNIFLLFFGVLLIFDFEPLFLWNFDFEPLFLVDI